MKDKKILLYAGTTEGRKLASYLGRRGVRLHVCVATAYGESLLPEEKNITVTHDRMDSGQMGEFMRVFEPDYVIDATHPYAKEVTKNLKSACEVMQVPYLRLVRGSEETKESICVENMDEAIKYLEKTEGNILVTTGSKELESYTRLTDYESRVYARVLSIGQVAVNCEELGFSGRHLICMQGPFSTEMNRAMLKEYDIAYNDFSPAGRDRIIAEQPKIGKASDFNSTPNALGATDNKRTFYTETFKDAPDIYQNPQPKSDITAHEFSHFAYNPNRLPSINIYSPSKDTPENVSKYLLGTDAVKINGMELTARGTQIKNYFGLKEGEPITEDMLKYAAENYVKDRGYDNNMTDFFKGIKDYKKMAEWISKYSPISATPLILNENEK